MIEDVIVETVQRASEASIKRHGGVKGWIKHLQAMDRARAHRTKRPRAKSVARTLRNGRAKKRRTAIV